MSCRDNNSFSYKTIHPIIRRILDERSKLNNTVQLAMPFVRATSTIQHDEYLGPGNKGFTLGLHLYDEDAKWQDIYSDQSVEQGNYPLIGYTYDKDGKTKRLYASPPPESVAKINGFFNQADTLVNTINRPLIPPPGITSVKVGNFKDAYSLLGEIDISVPSLIQLEALHRTFLIPGTGIVLEWGQQFASTTDTLFSSVLSGDRGEIGLLQQLEDKIFPWHNRARLDIMMSKLATRNIGINEIMQCYTLPSQGQYTWMFGRLANFSVKANSDGSFDVSIKIVGQGEDSSAYLTTVTARPPVDNSGKICSEKENSVNSYFSNTVAGGLNFKTLLDAASGRSANLPDLSPDWKTHVVYIANGNKKEGDTATPSNPNSNTAGNSFTDDAYFISWRFFVNVVLNHPRYGVMAIFDKAFEGLPEKTKLMNKIALLRPYAVGEKRETILINTPGDVYINDPCENYVGNNPYLRSIDLGTMLIVNEQAAKSAEGSEEYKLLFSEENMLEQTDTSKRFLSQGDFYLSANQAPNLSGITFDRGFLSTGVWLNHKKVIECLAGAETIMQGIVKLLTEMSRATANIWNLSIDNSYPESSGQTCLNPVDDKIELENDYHNYSIVDLNFRENSIESTKRFLEGEIRVHSFNKHIRTNSDGELLGSDLLECLVDLSLPKSLFTSIASLGLFSKKDLERANNAGKTAEQIAAETKASETSLNTQGCSNVEFLTTSMNESIREMFSIVTIEPKNGKSPDLTAIDSSLPTDTTFTCGQPVAQVTANVAGTGTMVGPAVADPSSNNTQAVQQNLNRANEIEQLLLNEPCKSCIPTFVPSSVSIPVVGGGSVLKYVYYTNKLGQRVPVPVLADFAGRPGSPPGVNTLFRIGHRNGRITGAALVATSSGPLLYRDAAAQYERMKTAFDNEPAHKAKGWKLSISSGFRSLAVQEAFIPEKGWTRKPGLEGAAQGNTSNYGLATTPGTSNHGWGLAIDVNLLDGYFGEMKKWLDKNGRTWGFYPIPSNPDGTESWHFDYRLPLLQPPIAPDAPPSATPAQVAPSPLPQTTNSAGCDECNRLLQEYNSLVAILGPIATQQDQLVGSVRQFPHLNSLNRYVEPLPPKMINRIRCTADGVRSNALGAAPTSLSIKADLTMPGIAGLRIGELFWIDRIPSFYKVFGAFQILGIQHTITKDGWKTKIDSRFNYLGDSWKARMVELYNITNPQTEAKDPARVRT